MFIRWRTISFILSLLLVSSSLAFAQTKARLIGKVVDPDGKAIQGVVITASSPQLPNFKESRTTDKRGTFSIDFSDVDVTYRYRFDKAGYETLEVQQEWHLEGTQSFTWTMRPGTSAAAVPGGPPPASTSEPAILAYNAGIAALKAKDNATAETKFKEAVAADPKLVQGWGALSTVQVQTRHYQEAADAAEQAMALGSRDPAVLTARWEAYKGLRNDAKAAEALKDLESVGRRAEEAKKLHNEAVALVKAGDNAGAFTKFQEALAVDPNLQASQAGLATAALKLGKFADAATAAEAVLKLDPKNEVALRLRYNACLQLGDPDRLFDALVGVAAVEPVAAKNGLLKLAFEAYDANDQAKAKARFLKVLEVDPNQPLAHYYLALILVSQGDNAGAVQHLERVVALAPTSKEAESAREMIKQLGKIKVS